MDIFKLPNYIKKIALPFFSLLPIIYVCSHIFFNSAKYYLLFGLWIFSLFSFYFILTKDSPKHWVASAKKFLGKIRNKKFILLILLFSLFLRIQNVSVIPLPNGDEFVQALAARDFLNGESKNMFGTYYWGFSPSFYPFVGSLSLRFFSNDIFAWRFPSVIIGVLTVIILYKLAQILINKQVAILASILFASFHAHIYFSRIGTFQTFDALFLLQTLFFLIKGFETKKIGYFILGGYSAGLSQYFYFGTKIIPLFSGCIFIFWFVSQSIKNTPRKIILKLYKYPLIFVLSFLTIFSPLLTFYTKYPDHYFSRTNTISIFNNIDINLLESLEKNIINTVLTFWNRGTFMYYPTNYPIVNHFELFFLVIGLALTLKRFKELKPFIIILCFLGILIFGGILTNNAIETQRITAVFPFISLLIALGIERTSIFLTRILGNNKFVNLSLLILLTLIISSQNLYLVFVKYFPNERTMANNGAVAAEMATLLKKGGNYGKTVYYFGAPRIYFNSFAILPFWVPSAKGIDVNPEEVPEIESCSNSIFIFLPERFSEKNVIEKLCPNSQTISVSYSIPKGKELFKYYFTKQGTYDFVHYESTSTSYAPLFDYLYNGPQ